MDKINDWKWANKVFVGLVVLFVLILGFAAKSNHEDRVPVPTTTTTTAQPLSVPGNISFMTCGELDNLREKVAKELSLEIDRTLRNHPGRWSYERGQEELAKSEDVQRGQNTLRAINAYALTCKD